MPPMSYSVLVIDDESDIRLLIRYNLEKEGFVVLDADNGERGIELARQYKPDLILLDVMMPVMDGIETCERLRKIPELATTMICCLTARSEDYSQIAGLDAGADDYITKPIKPKLRISRLSALLRRKEKGAARANPVNAEPPQGIEIDKEKYLVIKDGKPF